MTRRVLWFVLCIAMLAVSPAGADVGSFDGLTITPMGVPGTLDVDVEMVATTSGAYSQDSSDYVYMFVLMYYPYPYDPFGTFYSDTDFTVYRTGNSNAFEQTFSFTLNTPGTWGVYGFVYAYNTYYNYSTSRSTYTVFQTLERSRIPTATLPGIALLGVLLAGIGIYILRRA
jgi:hypothetical protein